VTWPWTFDVPPNETFVAQTVLKAGSPEIGAKLLPLVRDWWATRASALERAEFAHNQYLDGFGADS
jgi:hypothetical protein